MAARLDFSHVDAKGIFVVGNYGTGKSHPMAVVSALAEDSCNVGRNKGIGRQQGRRRTVEDPVVTPSGYGSPGCSAFP